MAKKPNKKTTNTGKAKKSRKAKAATPKFADFAPDWNLRFAAHRPDFFKGKHVMIDGYAPENPALTNILRRRGGHLITAVSNMKWIFATHPAFINATAEQLVTEQSVMFAGGIIAAARKARVTPAQFKRVAEVLITNANISQTLAASRLMARSPDIIALHPAECAIRNSRTHQVGDREREAIAQLIRGRRYVELITLTQECIAKANRLGATMTQRPALSLIMRRNDKLRAKDITSLPAGEILK